MYPKIPGFFRVKTKTESKAKEEKRALSIPEKTIQRKFPLAPRNRDGSRDIRNLEKFDPGLSWNCSQIITELR
jgi:hypothetical protein